jgi:CubicO group peptidase (beta-lactamase class C family)
MPMRPLALLLATLALACASPVAPSSAPPPRPVPVDPPKPPEVDVVELPRASERHRAEVEQLVAPLIDGEWARSIVIGLIAKESEVYGFGREHDTELRTPDGDTLYEIGSVTKVFTGLLLAREVEDGKLSLDDSVQKLLPKGTRVPNVTLRQLTTHTSGLPRMPANLSPKNPDDPYAEFDEPRLFQSLVGLQLESTPGSKFLYSNLGVALLGRALANHRQQSYEAALVARILGPLGMTRTRIDLKGELLSRLADGHDEEGKPVPAWNLNAMSGAGAIRGSAFDLLRFVQAQIAPSGTSLGRAIVRSHAVQHTEGERKVAYGWFLGKRGYWHNGQTGGHHAYVVFDGESRRGVVVLSDGGDAVDELGKQLMGLLGGESPKLSLPPVVEVPVEQLELLVGEYLLDESHSVKIFREEQRLYTQLTGQRRFRLFPESETKFHLRAVEASVSFQLGKNKATSLTIHQGGKDTPAKRKP